MNTAGDLIALEEQFWKGDANFYRQRLTAEALMVFPDPVGVLGREETVASIAQAPRWRDVEFTEVKAVMLRRMPHSSSIARPRDEPGRPRT